MLFGSWAAVVLFSGGCVDEPKRLRPQAGAAGMAGARAPAGGRGGGGGATAGEAGEAGVGTEAGASGSLADAGMGGADMGAAGEEAGGALGAGAGAGGAQAGSAGAGGEIDTFNEPCPSSALDGWASVAGLDFDPSLGQPTALEVTVSNAADLATYAASPDPYIIRVSGTIAVKALDVASNEMINVLDVKSNKTIVGDDPTATIEGGIRIAGTSAATADMISNVVIRNLRINALSSATSSVVNEADGIGIAYAHHVWIDHVDVWDAPGDDIDITNGSDYITVSWTRFRFDQGFRRTATRVGHSDTNSAEDTGRLKVTFHHDWWEGSVYQRMPRVRFGDVHVFDSYFSHTDEYQNANTYGVAAAIGSRLLVENNYFDKVPNPHVFFSFDSATNMSSFSEPTAQMVAKDNTYVGISDEAGGKQSGQGDAFTPPYAVALEPADLRLKDFVRHCTGPVVPKPPPVQP